jgi:xanthine dehydrogenase iron-sulfur cluster and FAD-binding subunit A
MRITTNMLQQLEQSIAPDAEAEVRIYAGGCDVRVRWNKGLREANQNIGAQSLANLQEYRDRDMTEAWGRLIRKFQALRDQPGALSSSR